MGDGQTPQLPFAIPSTNQPFLPSAYKGLLTSFKLEGRGGFSQKKSQNMQAAAAFIP